MSEWLTTGAMIDRLKVGQSAEGSTHWEVKRVIGNYIVELNSDDEITLTPDFLNEKWRILPNYVSFEEAMKALKEGKTIWFHPKGTERNKMNAHKELTLCWYQGYEWNDLLEGKWTIEND